jgi:hypothetical protein
MTNDAKRTSQLGIVTTLSANDRVVVLTNPATTAQTQTVAVSNFVNSAVSFIPIANTSTLGLVSAGPGVSVAANGQLTAPITIATPYVVGVVKPDGTTITVNSNGVISSVTGNITFSGSNIVFSDSTIQNTAFSTNTAYTFSNVITFNSNVVVKGIVANGSLGTNGQYLLSNGSTAYWATLSSTSANPNTHYVYSTNYVATANDNFIVVNNNGADRTIYLPNSGVTEGKTYTIKKGISFTSTNTIVSANGLLIDGSANVNINSGYGYVTVTYSNTSGAPVWWITSKLL